MNKKKLPEKAKDNKQAFVLYLQKGLKKFNVSLEIVPFIKGGKIETRLDVIDNVKKT